MLFDELPIYTAIYHLKRDGRNGLPADPQTDRERELVADSIHSYLHAANKYGVFSMDQLLAAWRDYRKSAGGKAELAVRLAENFGGQCFYGPRRPTPCSPVVSVDRLVPGSRGGKYTVRNCVLACKFHNSERGDKPIEDYLL